MPLAEGASKPHEKRGCPGEMMKIDLHTHSTASDGTLTPEDLVHRAKKHGIAVLSLTDHDTTEGLVPFLETCKKCGVRGLSGVELSAEAPDRKSVV